MTNNMENNSKLKEYFITAEVKEHIRTLKYKDSEDVDKEVIYCIKPHIWASGFRKDGKIEGLEFHPDNSAIVPGYRASEDYINGYGVKAVMVEPITNEKDQETIETILKNEKSINSRITFWQ